MTVRASARHALALAILAAGCAQRRAPPPTTSPDAGPAAVAKAARPAGADRVRELLRAEDQRDLSAVAVDDIASLDVAIRRQAARTLARIAEAPSVPLLMRALADEDADVVAWSAYGLG